MNRDSEIETDRKCRAKASKWRRGSLSRPAALACALMLGAPGAPALADPKPPHQPHHENLPKPAPLSGDAVPSTVPGSSTASDAPTVAVIGDSVAHDYAHYLAGPLGLRGVRVVDGSLGGCPVGTMQLIHVVHGVDKPLRDRTCPRLVVYKQRAVVEHYAPKVILWHSIIEMWDIGDAGVPGTMVRSGSAEWGRRLMAQWDDTLRRITTGGAQVVVILPLWYEGDPPVPRNTLGPSVDKLRSLYTRWAARHHLGVVDVAPVACPHGPPCAPVNGVRFRPDSTHFDDPGGVQVAAYLAAYLAGHAPALARTAVR
jgi:SGNH domain (fused to AT3 domains)